MGIEDENLLYTSAEEMALASENRSYDNAAKQFLSIKQVMAVILEQLDFLPKGYDREKILESINKFQRSPDEPMLALEDTESHAPEGEVRYDLRFRIALPEDDAMVMNVEAQHQLPSLNVFIGRVNYYTGRLLSAQKGPIFHGTEYQNLDPVCSIWICDDADNRRPDWHNHVVYSKDREYVTNTGEPFDFGGEIKDYSKQIFIFLGDRERIEERTVQDKLLNFLNVVFSGDATVEERIAAMEKEDISVTTVEEGAMSKMFELGAGLYRKGERRGELRGELKGERKGERRKNLDFAKKLMRQSGYSQDDAVKYLELPEDEEKNLLEDLEAEKEKPYGVAHYAEEKNKEAKGPGQQQEVGR